MAASKAEMESLMLRRVIAHAEDYLAALRAHLAIAGPQQVNSPQPQPPAQPRPIDPLDPVFHADDYPKLTLPKDQWELPSHSPRTCRELLQQIVNCGLCMSQVDLVWYFHCAPTAEFRVRLSSVFYTGKVLQYLVMAPGSTPGVLDKPALLSELYSQTAHATGYSPLTKIPPPGVNAKSPLWPGGRKDTNEEYAKNIFVVTGPRAPGATPYHALPGALTLAHFFRRVWTLFFRKNKLREASNEQYYCNWFNQVVSGKLSPLFNPSCRPGRPSSLRAAEASQLLSLPQHTSVHQHRNLCGEDQTPARGAFLPEPTREADPTIVRRLLHEAKLAAFVQVVELRRSKKGKDTKGKNTRRKKREDERPTVCVCAVACNLAPTVRGPQELLAICRSSLDGLLIPHELQRLSTVLRRFPGLQFPLIGPPVLFYGSRWLQLGDDTLQELMQNPDLLEQVDLQTYPTVQPQSDQDIAALLEKLQWQWELRQPVKKPKVAVKRKRVAAKGKAKVVVKRKRVTKKAAEKVRNKTHRTV